VVAQHPSGSHYLYHLSSVPRKLPEVRAVLRFEKWKFLVLCLPYYLMENAFISFLRFWYLAVRSLDVFVFSLFYSISVSKLPNKKTKTCQIYTIK
jgi:hypothetical protein